MNPTSRGDPRRLTLIPEPADAGGLAPVVGQVLFLPLTMMMYGLNVLARTARATPGPAAVHGSTSRALPQAEHSGHSDADTGRDPPPVATAPGWSTLQPGWRRPALEIVRADITPAPSQEPVKADRHQPTGNEEQRRMDTKNLQDDMLKTVRYWISFEKRDFEAVLWDGIDQVYDNLTDAQFTAWKMAEFMQALGARAGIKVAHAWEEKAPSFFKVHKSPDGRRYLEDIDHKEKKYLTVDWEVVGRVVRRKGRFDERKTEALEAIAEKLEHCGKIPVTLVEEGD
jgi:hypothetical protein